SYFGSLTKAPGSPRGSARPRLPVASRCGLGAPGVGCRTRTPWRTSTAVRCAGCRADPGLSSSCRAAWATPPRPPAGRCRGPRRAGAGIGLSYSHALADKDGGSLRLLPSRRGAVFELSWPVSEAPWRTSQRVPPASALNGLKVLVLEDDAAVMAMIQMGLAA